LFLDEDALEARGIDELNGVAIDFVPEGVEICFGLSSWRLPGSEFVRERIARKDQRVSEYRRNIGSGGELWLLLVVGRTLSASVRRPSPAEMFETRFDRVFFLECWVDMEKVVELTIRRGSEIR
jgi:hypothetical protein